MNHYDTLAQEMQDVLYLKNGSVLRGEIIEIKANESITLINYCDEKWVVNQIDIDKITKEPILDNSILSKSVDSLMYKSNGFYSNINVGFLFSGDIDTPFPPLSLMYIAGYQFDFRFGVGAGLGLDLLDETFMPVVLDLNYSLKKSNISHFIYLQGGYAFSLETPDPYQYDYYDYYDSDLKSKGGYIVNPGFGFKLNLNEKNALSFSLGYRYMQIEHTYKETNGQVIDRTIKYNRIVLKFGYHFW